MDMEPKTEREHIISLQGHITGVKKDIAVIKDNHLAHLDEKISHTTIDIAPRWPETSKHSNCDLVGC